MIRLQSSDHYNMVGEVIENNDILACYYDLSNKYAIFNLSVSLIII